MTHTTRTAPKLTPKLPPKLIVFDKDGVLLDLNATWMPMILGIAEYLSARTGGRIDRNALLTAVGVDMEAGTETGSTGTGSTGTGSTGEETGRIREDSVFAAGTFTAMQEIWQGMAPELTAVFADAETYRRDIGRIREERIKGRTVAKGDVRGEIARLRGAGWRLAVATNDSADSARMNLADMGIAEAFDAVICADSGFGRKPDGGGLLEACRVAGCTPQEAVMVGDTPTDWLAAEAAGFGWFVAIAESAPMRPGFIPSADLVLPSIEGVGDALVRVCDGGGR